MILKLILSKSEVKFLPWQDIQFRPEGALRALLIAEVDILGNLITEADILGIFQNQIW